MSDICHIVKKKQQSWSTAALLSKPSFTTVFAAGGFRGWSESSVLLGFLFILIRIIMIAGEKNGTAEEKDLSFWRHNKCSVV